jgi:hypothetical protein
MDFNLDKLAMSFEIARNFGKADSSQEDFQDVTHQGYAMYADISYDLGKFKPHSRALFASGNKTTPDMIDNGDTTFTSSKNNAFSCYSPFNTYLADSIYPTMPNVPLVAMGNGNGLNYGIARSGTFADGGLDDNLILFGAGFDYDITDKASIIFDWWYMSSEEKGVGIFNNVPKVISPDLGHELDLEFDYKINKNLVFSVLSGVFFPGAAYREERDDVDGSLFTPFVRGDGKADPAYQIEVSLEISF